MGLDRAPGIFSAMFIIVPLLMVAIVAFGVYGSIRRYRAVKRQGLDPFAADVQLMGEARRALQRGQRLGPVAGPVSGETVEQRLQKLEQLRQSGLVSPEEYAEQRRRILDDL